MSLTAGILALGLLSVLMIIFSLLSLAGEGEAQQDDLEAAQLRHRFPVSAPSSPPEIHQLSGLSSDPGGAELHNGSPRAMH